jgi:hypothetical protein
VQLNVGGSAATLNATTGFTFSYNTYVSTSITIKVVSTNDSLAILYSVPQVPKTFNYLILANVIKVFSNFTNTAITNINITGGAACSSICYITYSSNYSPAVLIANSVGYNVSL